MENQVFIQQDGLVKKRFLYAANKIQESLLKIEATDYSAYFICVLAVSWPDGDYRIYKGRVDGTLSFPLGEKMVLVMILSLFHWL